MITEQSYVQALPSVYLTVPEAFRLAQAGVLRSFKTTWFAKDVVDVEVRLSLRFSKRAIYIARSAYERLSGQIEPDHVPDAWEAGLKEVEANGESMDFTRLEELLAVAKPQSAVAEVRALVRKWSELK